MKAMYVLSTDKIHCLVTPTNYFARKSNLLLLVPYKDICLWLLNRNHTALLQKLLATIYLKDYIVDLITSRIYNIYNS